MKEDTRLVHVARGAEEFEGTVNLPVYRASTILSPDLAGYVGRFEGERRYRDVTYAANGTHNARALAAAVAEIEGGHGAVVTATGLSAVTMAISAVVGAGDHVLVTDSVYGPTRTFCSNVLARFGAETTYYDPGVGAGIEALIRPQTRLVVLEAPGSLTFEMQDVPAIVAAARSRGVLTAVDNTWATPLYFRPFDHGIDLSIQAGTKYIAGHSDLVVGIVTARTEALHRRVADHVRAFGDVAGPDDCWLALRGLRTLAVRLRRQEEAALAVATWLEGRAEVERVLYPPLPDDPGHALWRRDFRGASSLMGLALRTRDEAAVARMVDGLELFAIGSSWGGYESLIAFNRASSIPREVRPWTETPFLLRVHVGLEDPGDLIADLDAGLERLG